MTSARDIRIPVQVTVEEFVAFRSICDEEGQSMSGKARNLIRAEISAYAHRAQIRDNGASAKPAHD